MEANITQGEGGYNFDKKPQNEPVFLDLAGKLLSHLPQRTQEIIKKRFGLSGDKMETLEKIGESYSITRERVRQIVSDVRKNISTRRNDEVFLAAEGRLIFTIEKNNGIIKESEAVKTLNRGDAREANAIRFLAACSREIVVAEEKGLIEKAWAAEKEMVEKVRQIGRKTEEILTEGGKVLTDKEIAKKITADFPELTQENVLSWLTVLTQVKKNRFGKWGLKHWPEISPKGTREKIYLVLKEEKRPLHFTEIAQLIDKYKIGKKKAHPQTVHNELIKDNRFVLIGRGIYAMSEWGYSEGTIKDVIAEILKRSKKPLGREEILSEVFKLRKVKKSTVLINLNNSQVFEKRNNFYSLRK